VLICSLSVQPQSTYWKKAAILSILFMGVVIETENPVLAQITSDKTLPSNSIVTPTGQTFVIEGGTQAGNNLFHSFIQFSLPTNNTAYFNNASSIQNIFSRVTGSEISNIDGLIKANGIANLFLLNSNGIIFGSKARLDVGGSFVASTANRINFADGTHFSAKATQPSPLLSVSIPIGLQLNTNSHSISNAGNLAVKPGENLTLLGGAVHHTGSLTAPGGKVQVLGKQVGLFDHARIDVSSETGGGTVLIGGDYQGRGTVPNAARTYVGTNATIKANALLAGDGGNVVVWADEATGFYGKISARGGSVSGNGGFVEVSGQNFLDFDGYVDTSAPFGKLGSLFLDPSNIEIVGDVGNTNQTNIFFADPPDNARLAAAAINNAISNVILEATNDITFNAPINITTDKVGLTARANQIVVNSAITTNNGDIRLEGNNGSVDGINISAPLYSNGGNITIIGNTAVSHGIFTFSPINSGGGDINLTGTSTGTDIFARGIGIESEINSDGGNINFTGSSTNAEGIVTFRPINSGGGNITFNGTSTSTGIAILGNINSHTVNVSFDTNILGNSDIFADRPINPKVGNINLTSNAAISVIDSTIASQNVTSENNVGHINIIAPSLSLTNDAQIITSTFDQGNAGNINIDLQGKVELRSGEIFSRVEPKSVGNSGNININAQSIALYKGAEIGTLTEGQGDAGNVFLQTNDSLSLDNSAIFSVVKSSSLNNDLNYTFFTAKGNSGDVNIKARSLTRSRGFQIIGTTFGQGDAGLLDIQTTDSLVILESANLNNGGFSNPGVEFTEIQGNSGEIKIKADSLFLSNQSQIIASTYGRGNAGNVVVQANDLVSIADQGTAIFSTVGTPDQSGMGNSGDIKIQARRFSLTGGAQIVASTFDRGNAGNIFVQVQDAVSLEGGSINKPEPENAIAALGGISTAIVSPTILSLGASTGLFSTVESTAYGNAGNIEISAGSLFLSDGVQVQSLTRGRGSAGNIRVNVADTVEISGVVPTFFTRFVPRDDGLCCDFKDTLVGGFSSGLISSTEEGSSAAGGNIEVVANRLRLSDGGVLSARTRSDFSGGDIIVNVNTLEAIGGGQVLTSSFARGNAGNININAHDRVILSGSDRTFFDRLQQFGADLVDNDGSASGLFAQANQDSTGSAGNISIKAQSLSISDGALLSVSNPQGQAGNVEITINSLLLDQGQITAQTGSAQEQEGANINLRVSETLLLKNESLISTTANGRANGGNVDINTKFLIALPPTGLQGSDIIANAEFGNGGRINPLLSLSGRSK
jgi:filamentous hemagglutinin family protein